MDYNDYYDNKLYKNDGIEKGKESEKIDKKFNAYKKNFSTKYSQIKGSLTQIQDNIINYHSEIDKLDSFLKEINEHDKNYKSIIKTLTELSNNLQETITIEKIINQLPANQQMINMSEYVQIYSKVKEIYNYFENSNLKDKNDYLINLNKLMNKGFKVFQDLFYALLKRYEQINMQPSNQKNNNEKLNLMNKIKKLSQCLQDEKIGFDFTTELIKERTKKIKDKFEEIKMLPKPFNKLKYEKGTNSLIKLMKQSTSLFEQEQKYVLTILPDIKESLYDKILKSIYKPSLIQIIELFEKLVVSHKKYDSSLANSLPYEFFENLDVIEIWLGSVFNCYKDLVKKYNIEEYNKIVKYIEKISGFCGKYISNFYEKIQFLNNEKIENENLLGVATDTISFLSSLILYENAYQAIQKGSNVDMTPPSFINIIIGKMEEKSNELSKIYKPLKYIFLINNVYYIMGKVTKEPLNKFFTKEGLQGIKEKINSYSTEYLNVTWKKMMEISFNERNDLVHDKGSNELKPSAKEAIKNRFITFNEELNYNTKIQRQFQIIDKSIESIMINNNITHIGKNYEELLRKYQDKPFSRNVNKFIIYRSSEEVAKELKTYFNGNMNSILSAKIDK